MNAKHLSLLIALTTLMASCKYAFRDVATRVRYALVEENIKLQLSTSESATIAIDPDHWPDGCEQGAGYRLALSPYKGGKQVAVGDIDVHCKDGKHYYTGLGSEQIYVTAEMAVEKKSGEEVLITMRKTSTGVEIVALQ